MSDRGEDWWYYRGSWWGKVIESVDETPWGWYWHQGYWWRKFDGGYGQQGGHEQEQHHGKGNSSGGYDTSYGKGGGHKGSYNYGKVRDGGYDKGGDSSYSKGGGGSYGKGGGGGAGLIGGREGYGKGNKGYDQGNGGEGEPADVPPVDEQYEGEPADDDMIRDMIQLPCDLSPAEIEMFRLFKMHIQGRD